MTHSIRRGRPHAIGWAVKTSSRQLITDNVRYLRWHGIKNRHVCTGAYFFWCRR